MCLKIYNEAYWRLVDALKDGILYRKLLSYDKRKIQGLVRTRGSNASQVKDKLRANRSAKEYIPGIPTRRGVSRRVLISAEQLMKEYQADLDYLKDR